MQTCRPRMNRFLTSTKKISKILLLSWIFFVRIPKISILKVPEIKKGHPSLFWIISKEGARLKRQETHTHTHEYPCHQPPLLWLRCCFFFNVCLLYFYLCSYSKMAQLFLYIPLQYNNNKYTRPTSWYGYTGTGNTYREKGRFSLTNAIFLLVAARKTLVI